MDIKHITFSYDQKINRLKNVTEHIDKGKITTIIGPNGSGKSTLLNVITQHHKPQKGEVLLEEKQLEDYKSKELAKIMGVVHQKNKAPKDMTVEQLVYYGRLPYKQAFSGHLDEDDRKVEWALECTGLTEKADMPIDALSGGQQQRVWVAMALAQDTPYLFLDEPTSNLDIYYQYGLLDLIKQLNREHGITIVMVLHDINQAIQYSDHIIVMKDGDVLIKGDPESIARAELIYEIYGVKVNVNHDVDSGMYVVPIGI